MIVVIWISLPAAGFVALLVVEPPVPGSVDRRTTAEIDGYEAGKAGIPVEACPYARGATTFSCNTAEGWKRGWIKGTIEAKGK